MNRWDVVIWPDEYEDDGWIERQFDSVYINNFNGGDPDDFILSCFHDGREVEIATFKMTDPVRFQTSQMQVSVTDPQTNVAYSGLVTPALEMIFSAKLQQYVRADSHGVTSYVNRPQPVDVTASVIQQGLRV